MTSRDEYKRLVNIGIEKTGVRLQDAEQTGKVYEAMQAGIISRIEWEDYVNRLVRENKIRRHNIAY